MYSIEFPETLDEIKGLWKRLEETGDCFLFQTFDWVDSWFQTVGRSEGAVLTPAVVRFPGSVDGEFVCEMILPLCVRKQTIGRVIDFIGGSTCDYRAPVQVGSLETDGQRTLFRDAFREIVRGIRKRAGGDIIRILNVPETLPGGSYNPLHSLMSGTHDALSSGVLIRSGFDEYSRTDVKKKVRQDTIRQRNRVESLGEVRFVIAKEDSSRISFTESMLRQKQERYRATGVRNLLESEQSREFYHHIAGRSDRIHISALLCNDQIVSTHWGGVWKGRFYYLMPAHEGGEWSKYSPGRLLLEELLKNAFEQRLDYFDFTVGDESYKAGWTNSETPLFHLEEAVSLRGRLVLALLRVKRRIPG